jgi:predicted exporter
MTTTVKGRRRFPHGIGVWIGSLLALGAAAAAVAKTVDVRTGIEDFVQGGAESERLAVLGDLLASKRTRTVAFAIGADDEAVHRRAAGELRQRLVSSGLFAWVRGGAEAGDAEAFHQLFFSRRWGLVDVPADPLGPWVGSRVARSKEALASPMGSLIARIITQDPILAFPDLLRRLQASSRPLEDHAGQLQTMDGRWSVVFAQANAPALIGSLQTPVVETIERALGELQAASGGKIAVLWTGVNRFAVETERRIKREFVWIGILSTIPVFALYILVFRSLRQIFAGLIIIGIALGAAVLICQGLFGSVHGLALTFGASLIGVTVDYAAHYSVHLVAAPAAERSRVLKMLLRATATGVVTTVAAFAAIAGGRLPAVQQIAVLGVAGALIAFTLTHLLLPRFIPPPDPDLPDAPDTRPAGAPAGRRVDGLLLGLDRHARAVSVVTAVVLLGASAGLHRWRWQDDVAAFKTPLPALEKETADLQHILGRDGQGPTVVVTGADDEQALRTHEQVVARLAALKAGGVVGAFASVQPALLSQRTQRERLARLSTADLEGPYREALAREGFRAASFPAWKDLFKDAAPPLTPREVAASPLAFLVDAWRLDGPARTGYAIALQNVRDENLVAAEVERFPGVWSIRPAALLEDTYGQFRDRIVVWLAVGVALVIVVMIVVYRKPSFVLAGVLPALLGSAATLGLLAWLGIPGNVLHVVALVLVLGLGVDYGVYLVEAREGSIGLSIRGILLGAATTAVSFGALAFSSNTAIHTLGLTSAIGIAFTTATCPLVIFIVRGHQASRT